jgi:hypothetical protein
LRLWHFLLFVLFLTPVCVEAETAPIPGTEPVQPVFDKADLVCGGRVESVTVVAEGGSGNKVRVTASLIDSFKGGPVPEAFVFEYPRDPMSELLGIRSGDLALLFLSRTASGRYELTNLFIGLTIFSSLIPIAGEAGLEKLQHGLAAIVRRGNRNDQVSAMRLLEGFGRLDRSTLLAVDALSSSTDPEIAFSAIGILLKTGMPESISKLRGYLEAYHEDQPTIALISAGTELSLVTNAKALPDVEALSGSRFISIQFAAMDAIRRIASATSAPVLVRRLDDANRNVQYSAVITLAELFDKSGDYGPSIELFDKNPQKYIVLWKQWWADQGRRQCSRLFVTTGGRSRLPTWQQFDHGRSMGSGCAAGLERCEIRSADGSTGAGDYGYAHVRRVGSVRCDSTFGGGTLPIALTSV